MPKIIVLESRFNQFTFETLVPLNDWEINSELGLNLALNLGYDFEGKGWRRVPVDKNRGYLVSSQGVKASASVITNHTITLAGNYIFDANLNRIKLYIKNTGANAVWINFVTTPLVSTGYELDPQQGIELDNYLGLLSAISTVGASNLCIIEMSRTVDE